MKHVFSIIVAFFFFLAPFLGSAEDSLYDHRIVQSIEVTIINAPTQSEHIQEQILSRIKTTANNYFSQADFDQDLKTLAQEYDHVEPEIELVDAQLRIALKIWPKPVIRIISWEGNERIDCATLRSELGINSGTLFERPTFNEAFQKLRALYIKKGFFEAQLEYTVIVEEEGNCVDIVVKICEGRSGRIKEIIFCGFDPCEEQELATLMITKEYCVFTSWLTGEGTYNEEAVQIDEYQILNYLQNKGYADAQVAIDVCEAGEPDRILIYIRAEKGAPYCIKSLSFEGNCLFSKEKIEQFFTIEEGDLYSLDSLRETVNRITAAYGRCGYIDTVVDFEPCLVEGENSYSVHFTIEEGSQYRIGLIRVIGNTCTESRVILHECLLVPGNIFNMDLLKATEERLFNIGYFENLNVYPSQANQQFGENSCYRDVVIEVEETGTGNFSAFGGYSTQESLFGGFTITEKNFDHRGLFSFWNQGLSQLRGNGEYLNFTANIGVKCSSYVLSWTQPHYNDTPWSVGIDLERSRNHSVSKDYTIKATGASLYASYPLDPFLRFSWHYRIRNTDVDVSGNAVPQLREAAQTGGLISASGLSFCLDTTNSPSCPTEGIRSKLEAEYAGIGGDHHFFSTGYTNTYYHRLMDKGVLKLRADMRYINPIGGTTANTIPIDERLFLGGNSDIRGYRPYAIGPKFPGSDDPKGGMSLQLLSAEYNYALFSKLDGFLFVDSGALSFKPWHIARLRTSIGFGVRFQLMQQGPPVTLGIGFPFRPYNRSDVKRFFWSLGGRF